MKLKDRIKQAKRMQTLSMNSYERLRDDARGHRLLGNDDNATECERAAELALAESQMKAAVVRVLLQDQKLQKD